MNTTSKSRRRSRRNHTPNRDRAIREWIAEKQRHEQLDQELRAILRDQIGGQERA